LSFDLKFKTSIGLRGLSHTGTEQGGKPPKFIETGESGVGDSQEQTLGCCLKYEGSITT